MAGPERPFRAVTAGGDGGAHAAQRQRQYEGTEVKHLAGPLMVTTGRRVNYGESAGGREIPCAMEEPSSVTQPHIVATFNGSFSLHL